MGIIHHHSVVAVQGFDEEIEALKEWLLDEDKDFFLIGEAKSNGYRTVCLVADGSKEGWDYSNKGNERRVRFIEWMKSRNYWHYVEVGFGELGTDIEDTNCENMY